MGNTQKLKTRVEDEVREWLERKFKKSFISKRLAIGTKSKKEAATREFDAVSDDGSIVASIKSNSWTTSGGNIPSAKVNIFYTELYFFGLLKDKPKKLFIFTNKATLEGFKNTSDGKRPKDVELIHVPLAKNTKRVVARVNRKASQEMRLIKADGK